MTHIFISHSRENLDFAREIVAAQVKYDLDTWINWKSIPKGKDWEHEICCGIEEADVSCY